MLATELVLVFLAAGMAATTAGLVKWAAEARRPLRASVVVFLLLMMVAMVGGAAVYYLDPSATSLVEGFWVASALMSISVLVVFLGFIAELHAPPEAAREDAPRFRHFTAYIVTVVATVLANEYLMGWTFSAAAGSPVGGSFADPASWPGAFAGVVSSPWFLFTMSGEMLLTAYLLRHRLPGVVKVVLFAQSALMAVSPPALGYASWQTVTILLASAGMIALFVFWMEYLYRARSIGRAFSTYLVELLAVYAVMMAGLYLWITYGDRIAFSLSVVTEMVLYFDLVLRPERTAHDVPTEWQLRPNWTFALLALVFVSELFMGALLDRALSGSSFAATIPALPVSGSPMTALYAAVYNGFWFLAGTTASTWFLAMMGLEMGALVVFKLRETRSRETRVRLLLMLGMYGAFAVFFPSLYYPLVFPGAATGSSVPFLGWSMGIGSAPLAFGVIGAVAATYAITAVATILFGRRAICSTFCTAPLMFQGTTVDAMKSFNRSSPLARRFLSSRFSRAYSVTTGVTMASLVLASAASVLDQTGGMQLSILGADPTVFLYAFYFSVLWYVLFVTIPYAGNYNCVTLGWCYTGTIAGAFGRIGFFRLKVRDRELCRRCTTLDCAKSCPVGLTDMPGHFRRKGEFRSSKCCGTGDCVESCPYGNMYLYDARHWFREHLGLFARQAPTPLPMVRPRPARRPTAPDTRSVEGGPSATAP